MRPSAAQWAAYLARYHDERPGITEDVLGPARDGAGRSPYDWLVEAAPCHGLIVDLGCGSAPVGRCLATGARYFGVDRSQGELRRAGRVAVARADGAALPLADATADAVVASMVLMVMPRLEAALDEVRRVLRPGGALVATVAVRAVGDDPSTSVFRELLAALGQSQVRYPGSPTAGALPSRLAGAGLELRDDACGRVHPHRRGRRLRGGGGLLLRHRHPGRREGRGPRPAPGPGRRRTPPADLPDPPAGGRSPLTPRSGGPSFWRWP